MLTSFINGGLGKTLYSRGSQAQLFPNLVQIDPNSLSNLCISYVYPKEVSIKHKVHKLQLKSSLMGRLDQLFALATSGKLMYGKAYVAKFG